MNELEPSEFVDYLENTLIPDLKESGHFSTAEDFERCVKIINDLKAELDTANEER